MQSNQLGCYNKNKLLYILNYSIVSISVGIGIPTLTTHYNYLFGVGEVTQISLDKLFM